MEWQQTYPVTRTQTTLVNSLHHTPLLIGNISHPVRLARGHEDVRGPPLHIAIQLVRQVNVESGRVVNSAAGAVLFAVLAIDRRVYLGEQDVLRRSGLEATVTSRGGAASPWR
jgi:hypothetical protein